MSIGMYIHIPFRISKHNHRCTLSFFNRDFYIRDYFKQLNKEIELRKLSQTIDSIYIGGGDPTSVDSKYILSIMETIKSNYTISENAEITIEVSPICPLYSIEELVDLGFNRFNIKPITFDKKGIESLELRHNFASVTKIVKLLKNRGVSNINLDMYFAYPGQNLSGLQRDLNYVLKLDVPHVSYYSMKSDEEDNLIHHSREEFEKENLEAEMLDLIEEILVKNGYEHHEINHFSKEGYISKHNMKYWNLDDYIGVGLGASGLIGNRLYKNHIEFEEYFKSLKKGELPYLENEIISNEEMAKNFIISRLGLKWGINIDEFYQRFGFDIMDVYGDLIKKFVEKKILMIRDGKIEFTLEGKNLSNQFYIEII